MHDAGDIVNSYESEWRNFTARLWVNEMAGTAPAWASAPPIRPWGAPVRACRAPPAGAPEGPVGVGVGRAAAGGGLGQEGERGLSDCRHTLRIFWRGIDGR
ncbi:hypothetical protein GCM10009760_43930 [Kitasatospora kazusensis]|uniref:Uncharacterized protein n=1 Tax=Kitasatospora kazusensis TaxID=407974 RepID=A0ABP5LSW7_9ACTN